MFGVDSVAWFGLCRSICTAPTQREEQRRQQHGQGESPSEHRREVGSLWNGGEHDPDGREEQQGVDGIAVSAHPFNLADSAAVQVVVVRRRFVRVGT